MSKITNFEWLNDSNGSLTKITLSDRNGYYNFKENPLILTQSMLDNGLWFRGTLNLADSLGLFEGEVTNRYSYLWESGNYAEYTHYVNFFDVVTDSNGVTLRNYIIDNKLDLSSGKYSLDYINSNYVLIDNGELYYYTSNNNSKITKVEVSLDDGNTYGLLWQKLEEFGIVSCTIENNPYDLSRPDKLPVVTIVCNAEILYVGVEDLQYDYIYNAIYEDYPSSNICTIIFDSDAPYIGSHRFKVSLWGKKEGYIDTTITFDVVNSNTLRLVPYMVGGNSYEDGDTYEYRMPYGANDLWIPDNYYIFYNTETGEQYPGCSEDIRTYDYSWDYIYNNYGYEWSTSVELRGVCKGVTYSYYLPVHITLAEYPDGDDSGYSDYCPVCDQGNNNSDGFCDLHQGYYWCDSCNEWHSPDYTCSSNYRINVTSVSGGRYCGSYCEVDVSYEVIDERTGESIYSADDETLSSPTTESGPHPHTFTIYWNDISENVETYCT